MTGTVPNDQAVRDAAAQDLDRTLFVEAGAGSGKTTMLVDRVVALITSGRARMEQIAAITFTESAAAELRDRLAQEFETRAHDRADERAHAAALALDAAAVNTLHGFARTILAEQPFGAGLPPLFDVADESSDQVTLDERWDRFRVALLEEPADEELMVRALSCGLTWTGLREAALQCHRNWDLIEGVSVTIPPRPLIEADVLLGHLQHALDGAAACTDTDDTLAVLLETVADARTALRSATDEIDLLQTLTGFAPFGRRGRGQKDNWPGDGKDAVGSWLRLAEEERRRLVDGTAQWVVQRLVSRLVAFTMEGVRERRASGHLVFHDLLVLARNLVRDNPAARAELHRRFTHVLIDEFQDTDPLQAELALYLAAGPGADFDREWVDLPVPAGRLFFVGDPKQSIYRFRRADIGLFMKVRDHVVTSSLQLTTNFRSRPGIVEWVNAVFAGMFEDGVPGMQPGYVPLRAHRHPGLPNRSGAAPVIVLGHAAMEGGADAVREVQAREVATAIATMHAEEWLLGDGCALPP
jgi:ATP-dependent helicase/nuclease subunit A